MSKYYQVKVYTKENVYLTTWSDIVSDIEFNNEINSAGGQMRITLARNAGDYGEGSDVDFGHKVKVYVFDKEETNGLLLFQGYISAYTPIYKDDKVDVTILSYGSELNDYIIEGGDTALITQASSNKLYDLGRFGLEDLNVKYVYQTFKLTDNKKISGVEIKLNSTSASTMFTYLVRMTGDKPNLVVDQTLAYAQKNVGIVTDQTIKFNFGATVELSKDNTYFFTVGTTATEGLVKLHATNTNPYANGSVYTQIYEFPPVWNESVNYSNDDLYFVLYEYGGNTTAEFLSKEPTNILGTLLEDYNNKGGVITPPQRNLFGEISQEYRSNTLPIGGVGDAYSQIIIPNKDTIVKYVELYLGKNTTGGAGLEINIYQGNPEGDYVYTEGLFATYNTDATLIATSKYTQITETELTYVLFEFDNPVNLNQGTQYFLNVFAQPGSINNLIFRSAFAEDIIEDTQVGKLYIANVTSNNSGDFLTYYPDWKAFFFNVYDENTIPSDYRGGYISTGTTVSYTFNVNTILEGINKCVELAPKDWYWYLNQGTNELMFKVKNELPDHIFSLESDIIDAQFEKRIEDIVNTIYFTGGEISGGNNFFKKYINQGSIEKYGVKSKKYSDQRVTVENTADTIANSILETKSQPELRVKLEILDSNNNQGLGYDIESIKVGDTIAVRNITQQVGLSTWDYARWDESYWDYNIYNLSSLTMQVIKLTYKQDSLLIEASTIPVDVNKRIEDINRNLETLQTLNNPIAPE